MAVYDALVQLEYTSPSFSPERLLNPRISTTANITESSGTLTIAISYLGFEGSDGFIYADADSMIATVYVKRANDDSRMTVSGPVQVSALSARQSATSGSASAYREISGTLAGAATATASLVAISGVTYYRFTAIAMTASAQGFNTSPGVQAFAMTATVPGAIEMLFTASRVEFYNGRTFVYFSRYSTNYKWEMVNCNGIWYPLKPASTGNGYIEKMMVYGFWAWLYVTGIGRIRVKVANYEFGYF